MEMAVQTEVLGQQFYTGMAEKFKKDDGLVKLFTELAVKEKSHEKTFKGLRDTVAKSGAEPVQWEEVSNYMRAFVESEFFLGKGKSLPSLDHIKTVNDAVKFAIGFEKETLLYFIELRTIVRKRKKRPSTRSSTRRRATSGGLIHSGRGWGNNWSQEFNTTETRRHGDMKETAVEG